MRVFDEPNMINFKCPICNTADKKPVVLVGIDGTRHGGNIEAVQVHIDCIDLTMYTRGGDRIIAQFL